MSDSDLTELYSRRILALSADIPHLGRLEAPSASATARAPLCGSTVRVDLMLSDGRVSAFAIEPRACALGQASSSILARHVIGRSPAELRQLQRALSAMLSGAEPPQPPFEGYEVLTPARSFTNRHASILLAVDACCSALDEAGF